MTFFLAQFGNSSAWQAGKFVFIDAHDLTGFLYKALYEIFWYVRVPPRGGFWVRYE